MIDSPVPSNRCPTELIPVMLDVIATKITSATKSSPTASEPATRRQIDRESLYEKTVVLQDEDFDHLMRLFSHTIGSSFSCHDPQKGMDYTLSFSEKPEVVKLELASNSKQYTVRVQLLLLSPFLG
jgi:hypothetical protein